MKALAAHLGKPEIVKTCRLVQRLGENSAFSSFKALVVTFSPKTSVRFKPQDSEKLNGRRALLVLGVPSLRQVFPSRSVS